MHPIPSLFPPADAGRRKRDDSRAGAALARWIVVAASFLGAPIWGQQPTVPIRHGDVNLTVDLGVGRVSWPMPMDWDGDGDFDLIVSCQYVPHHGTYFFENRSGPHEKLPVFELEERVGAGLESDALVSYVDGEPRILTNLRTMRKENRVPGDTLRPVERLDFLGTKFTGGNSTRLGASISLSPSNARSGQWRYVDFDGDGDHDLVVGVDQWIDYGWDDAYDSQGNWTNGPLHGYVLLLENVGSDVEPAYDPEEFVNAGGLPIDGRGLPCPNFGDFDDDGDLDLLCGEFLDGFTYYRNVGTRENPEYASGVSVRTDSGERLAMNSQIVTPTAIDWDGDGDLDLVVGQEDGRVAFIENSRRLDGEAPTFLPPVFFRQCARDVKFGGLVTPVSVDWDGDGDEDLLCGNSAGYVGLIENLDGGDPPRWAEPRRLEAGGTTLCIQAGKSGSIQGPAEAKWGYTVLDAADWDGDGVLDLIVNSIHGKIEWYRGTGAPISLSPAQPMNVAWDGEPIQPEWNWKKPEPGELIVQWRTSPVVCDLDEDGLVDLISLDHEGYLAWFRRFRDDSGGLALAPGERVFLDESGRPLRLNDRRAGKSGRRKFCYFDYDEDGRRDLILGVVKTIPGDGDGAKFYRDVTPPGTPGVERRFQDAGPFFDQDLGDHSTHPTTVDWDRDGRRSLLIGAEDGRLHYFPRDPIERPAARSASVDADGTTLVIAFDRSVEPIEVPSLTFADGPVSATYAHGAETRAIAYSLSRKIYEGETGTYSLVNGAVRSGIALNAPALGSVDNGSEAPTPDRTRPLALAATIGRAGDTLTIEFSENVFCGKDPELRTDASLGAIYERGDGSVALSYSLSRRALAGERCTCVLTSGSASDEAGNELLPAKIEVLNESAFEESPGDEPPGDSTKTEDRSHGAMADVYVFAAYSAACGIFAEPTGYTASGHYAWAYAYYAAVYGGAAGDSIRWGGSTEKSRGDALREYKNLRYAQVLFDYYAAALALQEVYAGGGSASLYAYVYASYAYAYGSADVERS